MAKKKVWKEYRFEDGTYIITRSMSGTEKAREVRKHGKLIAVIETDMPW